VTGHDGQPHPGVCQIAQFGESEVEQFRNGFGLAVEPLAELRVRRNMRKDQFDGDDAIQAVSRAL
jgi:hypothetical protein